jgi:hypothetical protein
MVVIAAAILTGIGGLLGGIFRFDLGGALLGLIIGTVLTVVGYYIWTYVVQFVGKTMFGGQATAQQLQRTLGYAYGPIAIGGLLSFIPCLGGLISLVFSIWSLACGFFAVRETHKLSDGQTIVTVVVGWLVVFIVSSLVFGILGVGALGMGALFGR